MHSEQRGLLLHVVFVDDLKSILQDFLSEIKHKQVGFLFFKDFRPDSSN